ncbi:MAG: TIGR04086 family membrane protein, partial [Actinomycetota bacterium]|nr:TIGR04086 family membrane protein [Actinomycetota bacterium]
MADKPEQREQTEREESRRHVSLTAGLAPQAARGGISPGAILTGVVVAIGATVVFSALVTAAVAALGAAPGDQVSTSLAEVGIGAGIALVVVLFLAYLWGGYATGRMARGKGLVNGLLVPVAALVLAFILGAVVAGVGASLDLPAPSVAASPLPLDSLAGVASAAGIAALVAQLAGGALGGYWGVRWHTRLEKKQLGKGRHTLEGDLQRSKEKGAEGTERSVSTDADYHRGEPRGEGP